MSLRNVLNGVPALALLLLAPSVSFAGKVVLPRSDNGLDLSRSDNLVGWWGGGWFNDQYQVPQVCADPNYSVVILSFLTTNHGDGGYPDMTFNSEDTGPSAAQTAAGATGLMSMPQMASQIQTCQQAGTKVLLSLGGGGGNVSFSGDDEANSFATQLWQLFGGDTQTLADLRPWGNVIVDGFDLDNETNQSTGYTALVNALRSLMNQDTSKTYYISGAPQCFVPDDNFDIAALQAMDFVNMQFYNNGNCDHGQPGFLDSVVSVSQSLAGNNSQAKLMIGGIADSREGTGYISPDDMVAEIAQVKQVISENNLNNIAGYALWDLAEAIENGFDTAVKNALVANLGS